MGKCKVLEFVIQFFEFVIQFLVFITFLALVSIPILVTAILIKFILYGEYHE
jgi:hypothetical protein